MTSPERYLEPVWEAPIDLVAHRALAPRDGKVKGMFFRRIIAETRAVTGRPITTRPFFAFSDYPLADWLTLLHDAALFAHPRLPVRAGLRRLGRAMVPAFAESMLGKVVYSVAGDSLMRALPLTPRVWSVISNHGTAEVRELRQGRVIICLRNVWDFLDSFQLGSIEGGMAFFGVDAAVKVAMLGPCEADFEVTWR